MRLFLLYRLFYFKVDWFDLPISGIQHLLVWKHHYAHFTGAKSTSCFQHNTNSTLTHRTFRCAVMLPVRRQLVHVYLSWIRFNIQSSLKYYFQFQKSYTRCGVLLQDCGNGHDYYGSPAKQQNFNLMPTTGRQYNIDKTILMLHFPFLTLFPWCQRRQVSMVVVAGRDHAHDCMDIDELVKSLRKGFSWTLHFSMGITLK